jgi:aminoglycoside phosphotransferase (APT) family kinase protein
MALPKKAPKPTPEQFEKIANAISPRSKVTSSRRLVGGISCRMDALSFIENSGIAREVIVRQYGLWHIDDDPHPATIESSVLSFVNDNGVTAPTLILGDETTKILGRHAIVISLVEGRPVVQPPELENWSRQMTRAVSAVHALAVPQAIRNLVPTPYEGYERSFSQAEPSEKISKHPLGKEVWSALKKHWSSIEKPTDTLLHGDYWPGNTLWSDDSLIAIVDWEEPRMGAPVYDISVLIQDAKLFNMDIEEFVLDEHQRITGSTLNDVTFWRLIWVMNAMPDPGDWADDFMSMGGNPITPDEVRSNLAESAEELLLKL